MAPFLLFTYLLLDNYLPLADTIGMSHTTECTYHIKLGPGLRGGVVKVAKEERRTIHNMLIVLLWEALQARQNGRK